MNKYNDLIVNLMVIKGYAKDLHYNIADYSIHLLADRVQDGLDDFIDEIKENCLLAKGYDVLRSHEYYSKAASVLSNQIILEDLKGFILDALHDLELINNISVGDSDLLGRIGAKLQNDLGVINIILKGNKNV